MEPSFRYNATVVEVHDGDTYTLMIDAGFSTFTKQKIRVRGIDTPELWTQNGKDAKRRVQEILYNGDSVTVETLKTNKGSDARSFVRYVADVWLADGKSVADLLVEKGIALRV